MAVFTDAEKALTKLENDIAALAGSIGSQLPALGKLVSDLEDDLELVRTQLAAHEARLVALEGGTPPPPPPPPPPPADTPIPLFEGSASIDWDLTFRDEFEGNALDLSKWNPSFWWGAPREGWCFTTNEGEVQLYHPDNVVIRDGKAHLKAERKSRTVTFNKITRTLDYHSGVITTGAWNDHTTKPRFTFKQGFVEARIKVPSSQGAFPAFWLLHDKVSTYEIDIQEWLGYNPSIKELVNGTKVARMHIHLPGNDDGEDFFNADDFAKDFHVYGIDLQGNEAIWYIDGIERWRKPYSVPPDVDWYILLNLAVGGWAKTPDPAQYPCEVVIDYVRAWKRT